MTILNVVQPEEFDPSSFTEIDGKLKVAISSQEGNILQYKDDGLFAAAGGGNGVLERYVYTTNEGGNVVHKGINVHIYLIDGALKGTVYGIDPNAIDPDDIVYYSGGFLGTTFDDEKYVLGLPWAVEREQRVVLKMHQNGNPVLWVVRVIRPQGGDVGVLLESVTIVIDEMVNMGDLATKEPTEGPVIPELNSSHTLTHIGVIPARLQNSPYTVALYDDDKFALVRLDQDRQPIINSADNITGQLAVPYTDTNIKEHFSYCSISGAVIYKDGNNYWGIVPDNRRIPLDISSLNGDHAIIGTNLALVAGGERIVFYSMDSQSISYQVLEDLSSDALLDVRRFSGPEGDVYDCVVSGAFAHYLYVKNENYILQTIDLLTDDVTENILISRDDDVSEAKLIPVAIGGVIAYFAKGPLHIAFPNLAKQDTVTGQTVLKMSEAQVVEGKMIFLDVLPNVGFAMDGMTFFKFFIDGMSMALTRLTANLLDGTFSVSSAPLPDSYLALLMSGRKNVPLFHTPTTMGYDGSDNGDVLNYETLELGAVSTFYHSTTMFKFDNSLAVLAGTPAGDLGLFKVNEDNSVDTTANLLPPEYRNTVQDFVESAPALGAAVWKSREGKIVFARFSETTNDVNIVELGDTRYPSSLIMITKDAEGNYFVKEMQTNDGMELAIWLINPDNIAATYNHPDINVAGSSLVGSTILGDKLLAFGSTNNISHIRVLDARTGAALTQANFAFVGIFHNLKFQRVDHETLLIAENIQAVGDKPVSIKVTLLKITATEVTVIKKSTLALGEWESLDRRSLTNNTYTEDGDSISYQSAIRDAKRYYVKITASQTDFTVYEQEVTQEILDKAGILIYSGTYPIPSVNLFNGDTGYVQHDLKLTNFNTFTLGMVEHDNSPRAISLNATWSESNGQILVTGRLANTYTDAWTYAHLEVETPSGQIHVAKYRIGTNVNGEVKRSLWAIAEPGEYIFRLRHWDGGKTLEARATVPAGGKDFRAPIVTPNGDGKWVFSSENTEASARGVYNVYRSRHPVSIMEAFDYDGYVYDNIHTELKNYSIPTEERNGVWYIIVGHSGALPGSIWTPTFFTYGE